MNGRKKLSEDANKVTKEFLEVQTSQQQDASTEKCLVRSVMSECPLSLWLELGAALSLATGYGAHF